MPNKSINIFTIQYETEDKSVLYEIIIKQGYPLKYTHYGKTYAKRTEAVLLVNGFIRATNYITKHSKDNDNLKYAVVNVLKPIMNTIYGKEIKKILWDMIFQKIEELGF